MIFKSRSVRNVHVLDKSFKTTHGRSLSLEYLDIMRKLPAVKVKNILEYT